MPTTTFANTANISTEFSAVITEISKDGVYTYSNPRISPATKQLKPEVIAAQQRLDTFLKRDLNHCLNPQNNTIVRIGNTPISCSTIRDLQKSVAIYYDDTLSIQHIIDTILVKSRDGIFKSSLKHQGKLAEIDFLAKYKVQVTDDLLIVDEQWQSLSAPVPFKTFEMPAPNLRAGRDGKGESRKDYETYVSKADNTLNTVPFSQSCLMQAELLLKAMHDSGVQVPVLPAFGGGAFSEKFQPQYSSIMASAFRQTLENKATQFPNFKGVVFSMPNNEDGTQSQNSISYTQAFESFSQELPVVISDKDMTGVIRVIAAQNLVPGQLIAGHSRNKIGNGWDSEAQAQEETLTKRSLFITSLDQTNNPGLLDLQRFIPLSSLNPSASRQQVVSQLPTLYQISGAQLVVKGHGDKSKHKSPNIQFRFETHTTAKRFVQTLQMRNIPIEQVATGVNIDARHPSGNFVVRILSRQLPKLLNVNLFPQFRATQAPLPTQNINIHIQHRHQASPKHKK